MAPTIAGAELVVVTLELQNVSELATPWEVYFDLLGRQFRWTLKRTRRGACLLGADEAIVSPLPY